MPATLEKVLLELQQATAADLAPRKGNPSENYLADKIRVRMKAVVELRASRASKRR